MSGKLTISLHFNGHFPRGSVLAGNRMSPFWTVLELGLTEVVVTRHAKPQSKCHHQQTNTQTINNKTFLLFINVVQQKSYQNARNQHALFQLQQRPLPQ